jgi:hypothetical protein
MYIAVIFLVVFIIIGFFWGKHTIQRDVSKFDREKEENAKLKKIQES